MSSVDMDSIKKSFGLNENDSKKFSGNLFEIEGTLVYINRDRTDFKFPNAFTGKNRLWIWIREIPKEDKGEIYYRKIGENDKVENVKIINKEKSIICYKDNKEYPVSKLGEEKIEVGKKGWTFTDNVINEIKKLIGVVYEAPNPTPDDICKILLDTKQIILEGPPGTGKTRMANIIAKKIVNVNESDSNRIRFVQFHPAYTYEDFIMGLSVKSKDGSLLYEPKKGILKEFADEASSGDANQKYVLIIDEINRAPLSSVMGELLYALEKRNEPIKLLNANSDNSNYNELRIPNNLYIIGTMNTADYSLASLDYAMRRRFSFIRWNSRKIKLDDSSNLKFEDSLYDDVNKFFVKDAGYLVRGINPEDIKLGPSYFLYKSSTDKDSKEKDNEHLRYKIEYEIVPILREYYKDGFFRRQKKLNDQKTIEDVFSSNTELFNYLWGEMNKMRGANT